MPSSSSSSSFFSSFPSSRPLSSLRSFLRARVCICPSLDNDRRFFTLDPSLQFLLSFLDGSIVSTTISLLRIPNCGSPWKVRSDVMLTVEDNRRRDKRVVEKNMEKRLLRDRSCYGCSAFYHRARGLTSIITSAVDLSGRKGKPGHPRWLRAPFK